MSDQGRLPTVWVADDSATERRLTIRSLGSGYQFVELCDGSEVIEKLQTAGASQPDVLLLDWVMPGMSGDEVCRFLRGQSFTKDLPIILVTASRVETEDVVMGLSVGANDYVARPFAPEELRARVEAVLRTKQLADIAQRERNRLTAINQLGRALFEAGASVQRIFEELLLTLTSTLCDGCAVLLLPGAYPAASVVRHRADPTGELLAAISTLADPATFAFTDSAQALATMPPAYHPYIRRFGMRALAILPFPIRAPIEGVVTITRDAGSQPFDAEDIATMETCIEYASLAVQNALRFEAERTARTQLDAVVQHAPIGIVVMDRNGLVTLANPVASSLIPGIEQADGFASTFQLARWSTTDGIALDEASWRSLRDGAQPRPTEIVMHPLDGSLVRRLSITTVPLLVEGEQIGDVTTIEDVTAARAIEADRERVANFQEQMLGIVGHDLRNPLGAVLAGAEVIEQKAVGVPAVVQVARRMRSSANRMTRIVDQLLDVTRARLGSGIPILRREVAMVQIVRGVLDELALTHPTSNFQFTAVEDVHGWWDPDRLSQVVSNLASNALQYGRPAAPILVELSRTPELAIIQVTNTIRDRPIEAERLRAIFDPYQRGRDHERHAAGLGLGLYIVSEIVRAHEGTITASSADEHTVFRVELPVQPPPTT